MKTDIVLEAVIIEDEAESMDLLKNIIAQNKSLNVTGFTTNPMEALNLISSANPDIVFLDIKMPGKNGFEILDDLRRSNLRLPYVVFITAYDEFAIKAFEYAAFDYLLKPVEPGRLNNAILRIKEQIQKGEKQKCALLLDSYKKLIFRTVTGFVIIDPAETVYIEAKGNYSIFHLGEKKTEMVTSLLHKVEEQLPPERFFRINRSNIVNIGLIKKIETKSLKCVLNKDGKEFRIDISREKIKELIEIMKRQ